VLATTGPNEHDVGYIFVKTGFKFTTKLVFTGWGVDIKELTWPDTLAEVHFGFDFVFHAPIDDVKWPRSLTAMTLGGRFDQPLENVRWPAKGGLRIC